MNHPGIEDNIITIVEAFTEIFENFKKFIYLKSTDHYVIASLFTLLTYCYHEMDSVPYLYLYGPPSTGKGELLLKFKILCFNPIYAVRLTNAATCRALNERRGTFLLNEADILGKRGGSFILAIFLNGYKKEGEVFICDKKGDGLLRYEVFSPKVFATTTWVPITALLSRCLIIPMVKPDYKNRPKTFHTATDGKALEVLTRKIKRLFEETNLRQQIMEAYLNLEEIREIWGRDQELFSGMLAIAKVVDRELGRDLLYKRVVEIADRHVEDRKEEEFFGNWQTRVLVSTESYFRTPHYEKDSSIVAEQLRNYVVDQLQPSFKFRVESLGRILKNHSLFAEPPKVKWVELKGKGLIQKTCYQIDLEKLRKITGQYDGFVEPHEPGPNKDDLARIEKQNSWAEGIL